MAAREKNRRNNRRKRRPVVFFIRFKLHVYPEHFTLQAKAGLLTYSIAGRLPTSEKQAVAGLPGDLSGDHSSGYCPGFSPGSLLSGGRRGHRNTQAGTKIRKSLKVKKVKKVEGVDPPPSRQAGTMADEEGRRGYGG
jgi:hypothetical protein